MEHKHKRNQYAFDKRKYDHLHIQIPSGQKATLQSAAESKGLSTNKLAEKAFLAYLGLEDWPSVQSKE